MLARLLCLLGDAVTHWQFKLGSNEIWYFAYLCLNLSRNLYLVLGILTQIHTK